MSSSSSGSSIHTLVTAGNLCSAPPPAAVAIITGEKVLQLEWANVRAVLMTIYHEAGASQFCMILSLFLASCHLQQGRTHVAALLMLSVVMLQVHRVALAGVSPYFQAMFTSGYKESCHPAAGGQLQVGWDWLTRVT